MRLTLPLLAASVVLLVPAAAQAATVSYSGDTLVYQADPGVRDSPMLGKDDNGRLTISEEGLTLPPECTYDFAAHCPLPARVELHLGDGDDWNSFASDYPASLPVAVYGDEGKDQLQTYNADNVTLDGGPGADVLKGWLSNDTLYGGPGDDEIQGSGGNDHIEAGDGNDKLSPDTYKDPGSDYVDGGPGVDVVDDWSIPDADYHPPVSVSMDGVANDGRPGEGDNVVNVEKIESHVSGTLSGGPDADEFTVYANIDEGNSTLLGNGGNDKLTAGDYQDTVDGGPGNDVLNAGFGNDVVTGGPGQDTIFADATSASCGWFSYTCKIPFGNDVVNARDGEADTIDCGVGEDRAIVDAIDVVANCETVDKAGAASSGGPGGGAAGAPAGAGPSFTARAVGKKSVSVVVPCGGACKVSAVLTVKGRKLAGARKTMLKAGDAKLTLKFKRVRKSVTAVVKVTVEGADGARSSSSKVLKLKR
jgi:Ca2+-binding RTX toxin-like protein